MSDTETHNEERAARSPRSAENGGHSSPSSPARSREGSPSRGVPVTDPKRTTSKLVITNMTSNVTIDHLREICSTWGTIVDINFHTDAGKASAVVEFSKRTEAQDALDHMHRMKFDDVDILVSFTVDDDPKTAVPLSAFGQVSHKDNGQPGAAGRPKKPREGGRGGDRGPRRPREGGRGRSPPRRGYGYGGGGGGYRDRDDIGSYHHSSYRSRSPPRYDSYRSRSPHRRYDDRPPYGHDGPRDRSPRRYDDRDRYDRRDRYDDRRSRDSYDRRDRDDRRPYHSSGSGGSSVGASGAGSTAPSSSSRARSPSPSRGRYGSPEPKRQYHERARSPDRRSFR